MLIAKCIGCGCTDDHACLTEAMACYWLRVDKLEGFGVCSSCPEQAERWDNGDHTELVIDTKFTSHLQAETHLEQNGYVCENEIWMKGNFKRATVVATSDGIKIHTSERKE